MRVIEDIFVSIFNFKHIGKTLSKRPTGFVAASFAVLVIIYVLVFGIWYSSIAGDFVSAALDIAKPELPSFSIVNGQLTMYSKEPYIITHEDIFEVMREAVLEVNRKRFGGKNAQSIEQGFDREAYKGGGQKQSFCFVMDTTGAYKKSVKLDNYSSYAVITKDSAEMVDRVKTMPGDITPLSKWSKAGDIRFSPELVDNAKAPLKAVLTTAIILGMVIFTPIHFLLKALIGAFIAWIVVLIMRKGKPFDILYKISLYALFPAILLAIISEFWFSIHGLLLQGAYFTAVIIAALAAPMPEPVSEQKQA